MKIEIRLLFRGLLKFGDSRKIFFWNTVRKSLAVTQDVPLLNVVE
jgi:hypothetical protein